MQKSPLYKGKSGEWEMVCGLEIHAQISSQSKLFSPAPTSFGGAPNTQVSLVDAAMPGMLPVLNKECVAQAVRTGLALGAKVNLYSQFARKNYFYADLPQGYQISQFEYPIIGEGEVEIDLADGGIKKIGVERLHLEQDAGKSLHDQHPQMSYIDLNRSGVALMEIVSKPDMRSPDEAVAYVEKIRSILQYIGACDGNMAEGSMRADVNISMHKPGTAFGTRAEIKNVNSLKFLKQAIEFEVKRQINLLESGHEVVQETRLFDPAKGETRAMRSKEDAHDYRYFPDPDLLPLRLESDYVEALRKTLPELPDEKKYRFINDYNLSPYDASLLVAEQDVANYYEGVAKKGNEKQAANWVLSELFGLLNKAGKTINESPVSAEQLGELLKFIADDTISGKMAKQVFADMFVTGKDAEIIINEKGLKQITNSDELENVIDNLLRDNPDQLAAYRGGKENLMGWFVGQVMKATKGQANPKMVNEILKERLSS